jgi:hypothetical protein
MAATLIAVALIAVALIAVALIAVALGAVNRTTRAMNPGWFASDRMIDPDCRLTPSPP